MQDKQEFKEIWSTWLAPAIPSETILAHHAAFDTSVIRSCICAYDMEAPELDYYCTRVMAKSHLPSLSTCTLEVVARAYGVNLVDHHDPSADARAAADIALAICSQLEVDSLGAAVQKLGVKPGQMWAGGWRSCGKTGGKHQYNAAALKKKAGVSRSKVPFEKARAAAAATAVHLAPQELAELRGLAQGVLADGVLVASEIEFLRDWMEQLQKDGCVTQDMVQPLADFMEDVLDDGVLDEQEEWFLSAILKKFVGAQ